MEKLLENYDELTFDSKTVGRRVKSVWKILEWEPEDIKDLWSCISTNIGLLNAFNGRLTRENVVTQVRHQEGEEIQTVLDWRLQVHPESGHLSPNARPGWNTVIVKVASTIIAPSRIMNGTCSFASCPWKPFASSAIRKTERVSMHIVANVRAG